MKHQRIDGGKLGKKHAKAIKRLESRRTDYDSKLGAKPGFKRPGSRKK